METINLDHDITVFCITATAFPEGIMEAHEKLNALAPASKDRRHFGISRPENAGEIVYKAAAEERTPGEAEKLNCERFVIPKGQYIGQMVYGYAKDPQQIGKTFEELTSCAGIDPNGYCIEWYVTDQDVRCMVKLQ